MISWTSCSWLHDCHSHIQRTDKPMRDLTQRCPAVLNIIMWWLIIAMNLSYINLSNLANNCYSVSMAYSCTQYSMGAPTLQNTLVCFAIFWACPEACFPNSQNKCGLLPWKAVAASRSLALTKVFLWASATNAASWAGLDTHHNPVPLRFPTCPYLPNVCSHALAVDFRTPYSSRAVLALDPPSSARAMTHSQIDLMRMKKEQLELHTLVLTQCE
jgi:hypothetical protein